MWINDDNERTYNLQGVCKKTYTWNNCTYGCKVLNFFFFFCVFLKVLTILRHIHWQYQKYIGFTWTDALYSTPIKCCIPFYHIVFITLFIKILKQLNSRLYWKVNTVSKKWTETFSINCLPTRLLLAFSIFIQLAKLLEYRREKIEFQYRNENLWKSWLKFSQSN